MSLDRNAQVRDDLNTADKVVRVCWDNFIKTEPTYVLRDLIVIEIAKAREAERERCARIVEGEVVAERYRTWVYMNGVGNRSAECKLTVHSDRLASAIRNPTT